MVKSLQAGERREGYSLFADLAMSAAKSSTRATTSKPSESNSLASWKASPKSRSLTRFWAASTMVICAFNFYTCLPCNASKALHLSPAEYNKATFVYNKLNTVDALIKSGKNVEARQVLERLITYDPNPYSADVHGLLAQSCYSLGNDREAIEHYLIAMQHNSKDPCAHWNIALSYMHLGDYDSAILWAKKLISQNPSTAMKQQAERFVDEMTEKKAEAQAAKAVAGASTSDYLAELLATNDAHKWPLERMPLKVFIADASHVSNFRPQFTQIFLNGLNSWTSASQGRLSYTLIDNAANADLLVEFTSRVEDIAQKPGQPPIEQGIARTTLMRDDQGKAMIDKVKIQILVVRPNNGKPCTDDAIKETSLHELGHALGLNGHSPNASDIMHFVQSFRQLPALTKRDKSTIARLYSDYPSVSHNARSEFNQQTYGSPPQLLPLQNPNQYQTPNQYQDQNQQQFSEQLPQTNLAPQYQNQNQSQNQQRYQYPPPVPSPNNNNNNN